MSAYNGSKRSGSARWHSIADGTLWSSVALYLIRTAYTLCKRANTLTHTHSLPPVRVKRRMSFQGSSERRFSGYSISKGNFLKYFNFNGISGSSRGLSHTRSLSGVSYVGCVRDSKRVAFTVYPPLHAHHFDPISASASSK